MIHTPESLVKELGENARNIDVAVFRNGGKLLGNCYHQYDYLIVCRLNPDDTKYDHCTVEPNKSFNIRKRIEGLLMYNNAGQHLGKFAEIEGVFVASAWVRIDSGD